MTKPMPEFKFDAPLTLKGNIVVRNLDDAGPLPAWPTTMHGRWLFSPMCSLSLMRNGSRTSR